MYLPYINLQPAQPTATATVEPTVGTLVPSAEQSKAPDCQVNQAFPASITQWCSPITDAAKRYGVDPNLVAAMMLQELGGDPSAYSKSGAVGLLQVMPRDGLAASFRCGNGPCFAGRPTIAELQDPAFNLDYGTKMLAGLIAKHGSIREGLRYYGGTAYGDTYINKVMGIYKKYGGGN